MRSIWVAGFILLMFICALFVSNAVGADGQLPPFKTLVWTSKTTYGAGETIDISYIVTRSADITITIQKPDGTSTTLNPPTANANTVLKTQVQGSQTAGKRTVTLSAKATDGTQAKDTVDYSVQGLPQGLVGPQQGQQLTGDQGQQPAGDQGQQPPGDQGQQLTGDQGQGQTGDQGQGLAQA